MPDYNLSRLNVLVVERHAHMRHLIRNILHEFGIENVRDAGDEDTAFEIFQDFPADLVLTDWSPGLNGMAFLDRIRKHAESRDMFAPVVMITAFTELHQVCKARDAGINEFLAKPFSAHMIYARIKSLIEQPRLYVRADSYFGPDRRRRALNYRGRERRDTLPTELPTARGRAAAPLNASGPTPGSNTLYN
ncbi:MAG: two-component system response regulator [Rhodospirillales bacterium CG15_BIG_FIL_POST_REV_8_21_14_020_66_15]|nr:MAG: two-component system response regulator [Rhodospirillales bacterium CG15_BIG_FIL_POST_REV_8_21_14_020_66_15]